MVSSSFVPVELLIIINAYFIFFTLIFYNLCTKLSKHNLKRVLIFWKNVKKVNKKPVCIERSI